METSTLTYLEQMPLVTQQLGYRNWTGQADEGQE